jgi:dTDP-4-dehydrorhamnose 3,5-epimerase
MKLTATPLAGAFVIDVERNEDERGWFGRTYCRTELEAYGLDARVAQTSVSVNPRRGTLRGLHFQAAPHQEVKLVRCTRGAIHDVIVDLRPTSSTYLQSFAIELTAASHSAIYIPGDFAHGFLTLCDDVELLYQISVDHQPTSARGLRWDDPALAIAWPERPALISDRDASFPLLEKP